LLEPDPPPPQAANMNMNKDATIQAHNFGIFMAFTPFMGLNLM